MTLIEMNLKDSKNLLSCLKESSVAILLAALCLLLMMSSCGKKKSNLISKGYMWNFPTRSGWVCLTPPLHISTIAELLWAMTMI